VSAVIPGTGRSQSLSLQYSLENPQDAWRLSDTDRLGFTVFASLAAHVVLILGIGFVAPKVIPDLEVLPTLDIVLVNSRTENAPDDVAFLAQANQDGGGDSDQSSRPSTPLPLSPGNPGKPAPSENRMQAGFEPTPVVPRPEVIRGETSPEGMNDPLPDQEETAITTDEANQAILAERNQLTAELSQFWEEYQKRPKRKFLSARTREYKYAEYMEKWRAKVEALGNVHYPEAARDRKIAGSLVLDVAINPDGSISNISLERSSGHALLDNAARMIVEMAAPYEPFPANIKNDIDILHITRTWEFSRDHTLSSR